MDRIRNEIIRGRIIYGNVGMEIKMVRARNKTDKIMLVKYS